MAVVRRRGTSLPCRRISSCGSRLSCHLRDPVVSTLSPGACTTPRQGSCKDKPLNFCLYDVVGQYVRPSRGILVVPTHLMLANSLLIRFSSSSRARAFLRSAMNWTRPRIFELLLPDRPRKPAAAEEAMMSSLGYPYCRATVEISLGSLRVGLRCIGRGNFRKRAYRCGYLASVGYSLNMVSRSGVGVAWGVAVRRLRMRLMMDRGSRGRSRRLSGTAAKVNVNTTKWDALGSRASWVWYGYGYS